MAVTETDDDFGNTFYSEIDVVTKGGAPAAGGAGRAGQGGLPDSLG